MQKDKFQLFLEQSKFTSDVLNHAALKNLLIDMKHKKWIFDIELSEVIEPEVLLPFIEQIKTYFLVPKVVLGIEIKFTYKSLETLKNHVTKYYDYAIFELAKQKASYMIFKNFKAKQDNLSVKIQVDQDSLYLSTYLPEIEEAIKKFGFEIKVLLEVSESLTPTSKLIESAIVDQEKVMEQKTLYVKKSMKTPQQTKKTFSKKSNAQAVSIKEIPLDS
ncbi:MAG: hypothetical protein EP317_06160, partial [Bacillota bacterium]